MSLLGGMAATSAAVRGAGSVASLAGSTAALITGPKNPPGVYGPDFLTSNSLLSSITGQALSFVSNPALAIKMLSHSNNVSYLFDIPLTSQAQLNSQITDHFTEDNSSVQDHIALEPIKITLTGIASEVVYTRSAIEKYVQETLTRLTDLGILSPSMSASAQEFLNQYNQLQESIVNTVNNIDSALGSLGLSDPSLTKQQQAFNRFESWYENRALLSVETPWDTFKNMAIESLSFDQDENSKDVSTITVTFKQINRASIEVNAGLLSGRIVSQISDTSDNGVSTGQQQDIKTSALGIATGLAK
jgi:hypothetical protein